jgi:hypothetical protein
MLEQPAFEVVPEPVVQQRLASYPFGFQPGHETTEVLFDEWVQ